ncbi:MAG: putative signal transduction protein with EAL and GGDEF domain [Paraglaciecola psychrophila]|jgi:hypothetical protein
MKLESISVLTFTLFKHSEKSFIAALDEADIRHGRVKQFSSQPENSGIVESIVALSEAMRWSTIAEVIVTWVGARKSREVMIRTEAGAIIHAKKSSCEEIQNILRGSAGIVIIDAEPNFA